MNKKNIIIAVIVLILFAGFIAVTQELEIFPFGFENEGGEDENTEEEIIEQMPVRWFRSNIGGMILEEIPSRLAALRGEYALAIDSARRDELPEHLLPHYNDEYFIELRILYENGLTYRTQWIFRDENRTTRLNAVFDEKEQSSEFIEIFDEDAFLAYEYVFFEDGTKGKTEYFLSDGLLLSSVFFLWEEDVGEDEGENENEGTFAKTYTDFFRYNRFSYLRSVERIFHKDTETPLIAAFPRNIAAAVENGIFFIEKINPYPDFFGLLSVEEGNRVVFITDDRGRILSQTLYDEEDNIVWVIRNTWQDDRITSTVKEEDNIELLAEFEYDSDGNRITERNIKNGILERLVRMEGTREIEELYLNNTLVLLTVWEDGRKISETRISSR